MTRTLNIAGRLHTIADDGVLISSDELLDERKNKKQNVVNADVDSALADRYTKSEVYTKQEVNNLVSPNQNYVTVAEFTDLPISGATDTIYRVSSWDGSLSTPAVDVTKYSEYAWDDTGYVFLCVKTQIGEVYDISAANSGAKYADLSAALGVDGGNVPSEIRRGGMSVKFVQSSYNKYVQYRLMAQTFSTDEDDWQGVDDVPIAESDNLVKSGGVANKLAELEEENKEQVRKVAKAISNKSKNVWAVTKNGYIDDSGVVDNPSDNNQLCKVNVKKVLMVSVKVGNNGLSYAICFYDSSNNLLRLVKEDTGDISYIDYVVPNGAEYAYIFSRKPSLANPEIYLYSNDMLNDAIISIDKSICKRKVIFWDDTKYGILTVDGVVESPTATNNQLMKVELDGVPLIKATLGSTNHMCAQILFFDVNNNIVKCVYESSLDSIISYEEAVPHNASYCYLFNRKPINAYPAVELYKYICVDKLFSNIGADDVTYKKEITAEVTEKQGFFSVTTIISEGNTVELEVKENSTGENIQVALYDKDYNFFNIATLTNASVGDKLTFVSPCNATRVVLNSPYSSSESSWRKKVTLTYGTIAQALKNLSDDVKNISDEVKNIKEQIISNIGADEITYKITKDVSVNVKQGDAYVSIPKGTVVELEVKQNSTGENIQVALYDKDNQFYNIYTISNASVGDKIKFEAPCDATALVLNSPFSSTATSWNKKVTIAYGTMAQAIANLNNEISYIKEQISVSDHAAITFIDDDFAAGFVEKYKAACDNAGIKATFAIIPDGDTFSADTLTKVKQYQREGFQFALHPAHDGWYNSSNNTYKGLSYCENALVTELDLFNANGIYHYGSFVYPGSSFMTPEVVEMVKKWCSYARTTNSGTNGKESDKFMLSTSSVEFAPTYNMQYWKSLIDSSIASGRWRIFFTHSWLYSNGAKDGVSNTFENLQELMAYAKSKCRITTFAEEAKKRGYIN